MHAGLANLEMEIRHLELGHNTIENRIIDVHPKFEVPIWEPYFPFLSFVEWPDLNWHRHKVDLLKEIKSSIWDNSYPCPLQDFY